MTGEALLIIELPRLRWQVQMQVWYMHCLSGSHDTLIMILRWYMCCFFCLFLSVCQASDSSTCLDLILCDLTVISLATLFRTFCCLSRRLLHLLSKTRPRSKRGRKMLLYNFFSKINTRTKDLILRNIPRAFDNYVLILSIWFLQGSYSSMTVPKVSLFFVHFIVQYLRIVVDFMQSCYDPMIMYPVLSSLTTNLLLKIHLWTLSMFLLELFSSSLGFLVAKFVSSANIFAGGSSRVTGILINRLM